MSRAGQSKSQPKSRKGRIHVPKAQQQQIAAMHNTPPFLSIREIARRTKRANCTVAKIIKLPDAAKFVEEQREKLLGLSEIAMESIEYALENETDGRMAQIFFEKFGFFPQVANGRQSQIDATQIIDVEGRVLTEEEKEEAAIEEMCKKLAHTAMQRHKVFKTAMPELEEHTETADVKGK